MPIGGDDVRRRLRELPAERRRAIQQAVRRGEAVSDVRDAELAAEVAARARRLRRLADWLQRRWVRVVHALGIVSGVLWLAQGDWLLGGLLVGFWLYFLQMSFVFRRLADKAEQSEQENRALAGTFTPRET